MRHLFCFFLVFTATTLVFAQETTFHKNGVDDFRTGHYALTNATIYQSAGTKIDNGTLVIKEGRVVSVSSSLEIPKGAVEIDLDGAFIYPSFIELHSSYGLPEVKKKKENQYGPQMETNKKGAYGWNQAIKTEFKAFENFKYDEKSAEGLRKLGFGATLTSNKDGIARGSGALVSLAEEKDNKLIIKEEVSAHYSFDKGTSTQDYPGSQMGSIALLRQTYLDAKWYKNGGKKKEFNISLENWIDQQNLKPFFDVSNRLEALRADKVGDEFGVQYIIAGSGDEYQRMNELKSSNATFIVPLNYPKPYDVEDPYDALMVTLSEMKHWELAPYNCKKLSEAGIQFAITSAGLDKEANFLDNLKRTVNEGGLSEENALKALTTIPANLLGVSNEIGDLNKGKRANFIICSKPLFEEKSVIYENWIDGQRNIIKSRTEIDLRGKYTLQIQGYPSYDLKVAGEPDKLKASIEGEDSAKTKVVIKQDGNLISIAFKPEGEELKVRLSGLVEKDKSWNGKAQKPSGDWVNWLASYQGENEAKKKDDDKEEDEKDETGKIIYPFLAYGNTEIPTAKTTLIKGATVWTNEKEGILTQTDVLIKDGKISAIGNNLNEEAAVVIQAGGKHLTSGIIDEHAHIAISKGVNEWTEASSAEVRIGDVVNSDDINIYRHLSGGVTTSQLLHGSANPIGGQSAIIKWRWGKSPEEMKFENADGFIKFALGENVKQSNWGSFNTVRFPQTRMGVEQTYMNFFTKAKEYEKKSGLVRKDLELEALLEIINSKRFITCHSYVQSEINMLMKVAEQFGFRVNTFTHILEGYKVADKMKKHGVNASTFSDWWAYKYEVIDAIPYNAAILTRMGVNTAINSDDAEMGRRLNQEAAKTMKYGGLPAEEAWKTVTLNPAKMLHIDKKVGSIAKGKDADLVIWNDNPLSIYAKVEKTFVDGVCYYDVDEDARKRKEIAKERARLIQKMLAEKKSGKPTQKAKKKGNDYYNCLTGTNEIHIH